VNQNAEENLSFSKGALFYFVDLYLVVVALYLTLFRVFFSYFFWYFFRYMKKAVTDVLRKDIMKIKINRGF